MAHNVVRLPLILGGQAARNRAAALIAEGQPFANSTGYLRGGPMRTWLPENTWLPQWYWEQVLASTYVIWSWDTPIAWRRADGVWEMPDLWYSVSTARHQHIVVALLRTETLRRVA